MPSNSSAPKEETELDVVLLAPNNTTLLVTANWLIEYKLLITFFILEFKLFYTSHWSFTSKLNVDDKTILKNNIPITALNLLKNLFFILFS